MAKILTAKVIKTFPGRPDDETQVREVQAGEVLTGELARVAIDQKWAEEIAGDATPDADADARGKTGRKKPK